MSQITLIECDFTDCHVRVEAVHMPGVINNDKLKGWTFLREPSQMNRDIDICPKHGSLFKSREVASHG